MALQRRFQGPLAVTLAMEWRFQGLLAVKLALERWFRERLSAWRDPKAAPWCRKERPIAPEWTPRGRKSMRIGPWKPKKRTLSRSSLRYQSWNAFLLICGVFAKSAKPLKYRACQQKQRLGPLRCGSRWNLKKHRKCDGFRDPWTSGWPWNGGSRSLWTSSWLWNGDFRSPWTPSWLWNGRMGRKGRPGRQGQAYFGAGQAT